MTDQLRAALERLMASSRKARLAGALPAAEEEDEEEDETLAGGPRAPAAPARQTGPPDIQGRVEEAP